MAEEHKKPKVNPGQNITEDMRAALEKAWAEQSMRENQSISESRDNADQVSRQGGIPKLPKNDPNFIDRANSVEKAAPVKKTKKPKDLSRNAPANWAPPEGQDAAKAIASEWAQRARDKINENKPKRNNPNLQYFLECHYCGGPGVFFTEQPQGSVPPSQWFASYKSTDQYWPPEVIPECQCCLEDGKKTKLRVLWYDSAKSAWGPYARMVKSIEKKSLEEKEASVG